MPERTPTAGGVLDPRLGVSDKKGICSTCGGKLTDCMGHFGYIRLVLPVFHIGYFKNIISILQCICKECSRVLIPEEERQWLLSRLRRSNESYKNGKKLEEITKRTLMKRLLDRCKRTKICPHCGSFNGTVKKAAYALKIVHEKYSKNKELMQSFALEFEEALKYNDAIRPCLSKVQDDLNPIKVLGILQNVPVEDCDILQLAERPEHLILSNLPVPPVSIRPTVYMEPVSGSNEDDITMKLSQIIEVNNVLRQGLEKGLAIVNLMENWDFLQIQCAMYINSELPGLPPNFQGPGKPLRGFVQRLKGKQGRFRGNLSGKRVDFSGRQ